MNNNFGSRVRWFAKDFHKWQSHEWKIIGKSHHVWYKIVIHGNECIILFLIYAIFMSWTQCRKKQLSIVDFATAAKDRPSIVTSPNLIYDVWRTWGTGIVTSYSSIFLARANWCKGNLHQWITTENIDFSQPGNHGLACKKLPLCPDICHTNPLTGQFSDPRMNYHGGCLNTNV